MRNLISRTSRLCLVTNIKHHHIREYKEFVRRAVLGGVTQVQLREKGDDYFQIKQKAIELQQVLKPFGIPLIINDFVELAALINADGVHLGQQDMTPSEARKILGKGKIIGLSIESYEDLAVSNEIEEINYVTASAVFKSKTKPDCKKMWGIEGLSYIVNNSRHPVTAIGGIRIDNVEAIISTGAYGVAVVGAIHDFENPYIAAKNLRTKIDNAALKGGIKL